MTQSEFYALIAKTKVESPNLFQFIIDFLDDKVSTEEVKDFLKLQHRDKREYIKNYQARA